MALDTREKRAVAPGWLLTLLSLPDATIAVADRFQITRLPYHELIAEAPDLIPPMYTILTSDGRAWSALSEDGRGSTVLSEDGRSTTALTTSGAST